ncbi:hypothetical protein PRUB_b0887 [Pseudoalteromonas rubra]|uniref:Uncharacterized protein n=1 Tax=Pseudoalteromonas rubra TaxID=43658 RepID=A0A8T0C153_9GAMM|nr:hypothetical protein PRUB_b0887 [Pseudoalteromonas rubra]
MLLFNKVNILIELPRLFYLPRGTLLWSAYLFRLLKGLII